MAFSDQLLDDAEPLWEVQKDHPFVRELVDGSLGPDSFRHWTEQDYHYLLDYAHTFAIAGVRARDEKTFIEKYTSDEFREAVAWMWQFVDRCAEEYADEYDAMRAAFTWSARLEAAFWKMVYTREEWPV